jgi:hypothetical protein
MLAATYVLLLTSSLAVAAPTLGARGEQKATYYNVGDSSQNDGNAAGAVACSDRKYSDSEWFVALGNEQFAGGTNCGKTVSITVNGKTLSAPVADSCTSCEYGHIDLSAGLFKELGSESEGELNDIEWHME